MKFLKKTFAALLIVAVWHAAPVFGYGEETWAGKASSYTVTAANAATNAAEESKENETYNKIKSEFKTYLAKFGVTSGSQSLTDDVFTNTVNDILAVALDPSAKTEVTDSDVLTTNMGKATDGRKLLMEEAETLFWTLAIIQLCFTLGVEFIGSGLDLQVFVAALIRYFITVGFFWYIVSSGPEIIASIVNYFVDVGDSIRNSSDLSGPAACFYMGIELVQFCYKAAIAHVHDVSFWDLTFAPFIDALIMAFVCGPCAIVIAFILMYIAMSYVITTFEGYFLVTASCLLMGLGGCRFTWGIIDHILRMMAQVGLKLMTCILLMSGVTKVALTYMYDVVNSSTGIISMVVLMIRLFGVCIIFVLLTQRLPPYIASLIPSGNPGSSGTGFFPMLNSAMHTVNTITHAAGKLAGAGSRAPGNFARGFANPEKFGGGGNLGGGRTGWTMAGALGSAAGGITAGAIGTAKMATAGAFNAGGALAEKANAPLGPVGKAMSKAAGAAVGASHGLMRAADDPGKAMGNAADTAFGARKGLLNTIDNPGKVMDKVAGAAAEGGKGILNAADKVGQAITSSAARGFNGIIGKSPDGTSNTSGNSGSGAVSGAGRSANNTPNTPSASGNSEKSAGSTGNNAAGGTGNAAGTAPNAPSVSGGAQKPSGNNAKRAEVKTKTSAKSGEGAVFKGKGKMFEAAGFKKGAKSKEDGKK